MLTAFLEMAQNDGANLVWWLPQLQEQRQETDRDTSMEKRQIMQCADLTDCAIEKKAEEIVQPTGGNSKVAWGWDYNIDDVGTASSRGVWGGLFLGVKETVKVPYNWLEFLEILKSNNTIYMHNKIKELAQLSTCLSISTAV